MINQTLARHILLRTDEISTDTDTIRRLNTLRERANNGEDFGGLARSNSQDRGSAVNGGDLGWLNPGDVVPAFEEQMDRLAVGEISDPFRTQFGFHIIEVVDRRTHDGTEEVRRAQAREVIRQRKTEEDLQSWLRQLRDEAFVEYRLEEE